MSGCFGRAEAMGHAGEVLQGAMRRRGKVQPFLVTLPAPCFRSVAEVRRADEWRVTPGWKTKALRAALLACPIFEVAGALEVEVWSDIPVGRGCGSSTADCVAAVRAVADLEGRQVGAEQVGRLAQLAEKASDSTMFDLEPVVFLPRFGMALRRFEWPWPAMHVTVVDLGGAAVDTLACKIPRYSPGELDEFVWLVSDLESSLRAGDPEQLGRVASQGAAIHQRHRKHPHWHSLHETAMSRGAFGVAVAHSGTVAAVLSAGPVGIPAMIEYELIAAKEGARNADIAGGRR